MKREIKFRAWNEDKKQMIYPSILGIQNENFAWEHGRDYLHNCQDWGSEDGFIYNPILMQYTGLKDKNGKEIYEGDILKSTFSDYTMRVEYDPPRFVLHVNEYDLRNAVYEITRLSELEIIGNIYDNPELLKSN